jgi:uncharacterized protein (DUF305 family)
MKLKSSILALAAFALLVLAGVVAGCGSDEEDTGAGNRMDAAFIADMTAHHEGAIDMARLARTRAEHREIRQMADAIVDAQEGEIAVMRRIEDDLHSMGMHDGGHMGMSAEEMGMDMDMSMLKRARPFDRAFIDAMIPHHQGAIAMARELLEKGEQPALRRMAHDIIEAQSGEIAQMRAWRKRWYGSSRTRSAMHDEHH